MLAAFGGPQQVFDAPASAQRDVTNAATAGLLIKPPQGFDQRLGAAKAWLEGGTTRCVIALGDADYPPALLATADPPLLLFVAGQVGALAAPSVAIVGSRRATSQGLANARAFAKALADAGHVIVSGLALGIDAAAHEGALASSATPATVAVMGTGPDQVYPSRHQALAARIADRGALVSEYAPGMPPLRENFPQRNRIIAGLAQGTLVVEAALQSGSLITARLASEAGREVYALPGSIHAEQSRGCHALLRQGAMLVESAQEIADDLRPSTPRRRVAATPPPATPADPLLDALGHDPMTLDVLIDRTGEPVDRLNARLLELELQGMVERLPGGRFQRVFRG